MILSTYNSRIRFSDHTDLIFNSRSEQFVIVPTMWDDVQLTENPQIASFLRAKGILVDETLDERALNIKEYSNSAHDASIFRLIVNPTLNCNFRCWYCYESHKTTSDMSKEVFDRTKDLIKFLFTKYPKIELAFFGGEPLLKFSDIVLPLMDCTHKAAAETGKDYIVSFTTNGWFINDDFIQKVDHYNLGVFQITLDGGPNTHNITRISKNNNSFDKIVGNIIRLAKAQKWVLIRINVTKENIQGAFEIPKYFRNLSPEVKNYLRVSIQQVWQDAKNDILNDRLSLYEDFLNIGLMPWKRTFNYTTDLCYGDALNSCVVNYNGMLYKCTAIDFDNTENEGSIFEEPFLTFQEKFRDKIEKKKLNPECQKCRIQPLCNGGCYKCHLLAQGKEFCRYPSDKDKDLIITQVIKEQLFMRKHGLL